MSTATATATAPLATNEDVASHYDDLDQFYREIWGEHVHHGVWRTGSESDLEAAENLVEIVVKLGNVGQGTEVCDVGCGYGATAKIEAGRHGANVTAMTLSQVQLDYAIANNSVAGKTTYMVRDWYENQLPDSRFDVVQSVESMEHMADLPRFFREAWRVMKPGGKVVICAWMSCENPGPLARRWLLDPIVKEAALAGVRPASEFQAATEAAGFKNFEMTDITQQVKRTWPLCAIRTIKGLLTKPHYRRFLFSSKNPNRIFALTLFRIWAAYELGVMRYGVYSADKA